MLQRVEEGVLGSPEPCERSRGLGMALCCSWKVRRRGLQAEGWGCLGMVTCGWNARRD